MSTQKGHLFGVKEQISSYIYKRERERQYQYVNLGTVVRA